MALLDPVTRIPTLGKKKPSIPKKEKPSFSKNFSENLQLVAKHINVVDLERGKEVVTEVANFCLEGNPAFLFRVKSNLENIQTKVELQKYVYNSILRGEKLYIRR